MYKDLDYIGDYESDSDDSVTNNDDGDDDDN